MESINENLHFIANDLYHNSNYKNAIEFYNLIIGYNKQYIIYSNISACYLQSGDYLKALEYGLKSVNDNNKYDIGWGRIGSAYKALNKLNDALTSFKIAYNLNKKDIYKKYILYLENKIDSKITKKNIFNMLLNNKDILNKIGDVNFRTAITNIRNSDDIINNKDIMNIMDNIIDNL